MDGPRACRIDELAALRRLQNTVFRPEGGDMFEQYPPVYGEHNVDNLRIITDGDRVVSCVGFVERWASIEGCAISCALIGGVGTHPDYRNRGLATACLRDALAKARADGVDLAFISGRRGLYLREGARPVGRHWQAVIDRAIAGQCADPSLHVTPWDPEREMTEVAAVYRREPTRWLRPLDDYRFFAQSGCVGDEACAMSVVRRDEQIVAYLIASEPDQDGRTLIVEFAGERAAVLGALSAVMQARGATSLTIEIPGHDHDLLRRVRTAGGQLARGPVHHNTVLIVNFPSLMERLRHRFEEELSAAEAARFNFREAANEAGEPRVCVIERDGEEIARLDRADIVRLLFGDASEHSTPPPAGVEILLPSGPLPLPQYGLNYV